jgi:hypothetical protein
MRCCGKLFSTLLFGLLLFASFAGQAADISVRNPNLLGRRRWLHAGCRLQHQSQLPARRGHRQGDNPVFRRRFRADALPLVLARRAGGQSQSDIPAFIPRPHPAVPAVQRCPAPELSLARRRPAHPVAAAQLAGARKGYLQGRSTVLCCGAHAPRPEPDAENLPGQRTGQPGLEPFLGVGALELHAHRDRRAWWWPRCRRAP